MKDFNEVLSKDREFQLQDQVFTWKDVRPEVLSEFEAEANGDDPNAQWALMDRQIMIFLPDDDHARWIDLRARVENPVTVGQMTALLLWLMEEQTGRPTEAPSPSAPGPGKTGRSSKAA